MKTQYYEITKTFKPSSSTKTFKQSQIKTTYEFKILNFITNLFSKETEIFELKIKRIKTCSMCNSPAFYKNRLCKKHYANYVIYRKFFIND